MQALGIGSTRPRVHEVNVEETMTQLIQILVAILIAAVFLAPALLRPMLGRSVLSATFLGGALFNLVNTLPNTPGSLVTLVATAPIPPYRQVVEAAVAWNATPAIAVATIIFEVVVGALMLWRGPLARLALLAG